MKVKVLYKEHQYELMHRMNGNTIVDSIEDADVIQFTGGEDVTPSYYKQDVHPATMFSEDRDRYEKGVFDTALQLGIPMLGICRGGQFLNVMCGGRMYQHVNNHAVSGGHVAVDVETGKMTQVSSTHHQMMDPSFDGQILLVASESTWLESMENGDIVRRHATRGGDVEAVWYAKQKCLCFQPHPEFFNADHPCQELYFDYINRFIKGQ